MGATRLRRRDEGRIDRSTIGDVRRLPEPSAGPTVQVGAVHDPAEADADRLAAQALAVAADLGAPASPAGEHAVHRLPSGAGVGAEGGAIPAAAIDRARGAGKPLAAGDRSKMEAGFGTDLGHVRVHDGPAAASLARGIGAQAFTLGSEVFLGDEARTAAPGRRDQVLAHELAHVVQAGGDVHRFPATALSSSVKWGELTGSVFRPGEGVSGGIYILKAKDTKAPLKTVVAKPIFRKNGLGFSEVGEQLAFADRFLREEMGVNAPASRVVNAGSPEFGELVALCQPKQPTAKVKDDHGNDVDPEPLSAAGSFVVMGEVPDGRSVAGLARDAHKSDAARSDLEKAIFDAGFLNDLGRICVGDLLLGNIDRIVAGGSNLGNVMVSMTKGGAKAHAIDTSAVLKPFEPKKVLETGGGSIKGWDDVKRTVDNGPGAVLDLFMEAAFYIAGKAAPAPQGGATGAAPDLEALLGQAYQADRDRLVGAFEAGWQSALFEIFMLVNSTRRTSGLKKQLDAFAGGPGDEALRYETLMVNASYLAGRAFGETHEEAAGAIAPGAYRTALAGTDVHALVPPKDELGPDAVAPVHADAYKADLEHPIALPPPRKIGQVRENEVEWRPDVVQVIQHAHSTAIRHLAEMGTKTRGLRRTEQPRNRQMAGRHVADSYLLGAGALRTLGMAGAAAQKATLLTEVLSVQLSKGDAAEYSTLARELAGAVPKIRSAYKAYEPALGATATSIGKIKKYKLAPELSQVLSTVQKVLGDKEQKTLKVLEGADLPKVADALRAASAPQVRSGGGGGGRRRR